MCRELKKGKTESEVQSFMIQRSEEKELAEQTGRAGEEEENKVSMAPGKPKRNYLEREWSISLNAPENSSKRKTENR